MGHANIKEPRIEWVWNWVTSTYPTLSLRGPGPVGNPQNSLRCHQSVGRWSIMMGVVPVLERHNGEAASLGV
jgi:hypothetical protein